MQTHTAQVVKKNNVGSKKDMNYCLGCRKKNRRYKIRKSNNGK